MVKVLVVEDEASIREMIALNLGGGGGGGGGGGRARAGRPPASAGAEARL